MPLNCLFEPVIWQAFLCSLETLEFVQNLYSRLNIETKIQLNSTVLAIASKVSNPEKPLQWAANTQQN